MRRRVANDSVVLWVVAGVGGTRRASVSVGLQVGTATRVVSYDGAAVGGGGSVSASNAASSGGVNVSVVGGGFGEGDYSVSVRFGGSEGMRVWWMSSSRSGVGLVGAGVGGSRGRWRERRGAGRQRECCDELRFAWMREGVVI